MPLVFPPSPTNGQTHTQNGRTWTWNASVGAWLNSTPESIEEQLRRLSVRAIIMGT